MSDKKIEIEIDILRYRPEEDDKPVMQTYKIPYNEELSILEALQYIKDHLDGTVSFRWSFIVTFFKSV
jgi:fumarate reductase iron-sulfur subunit